MTADDLAIVDIGGGHKTAATVKTLPAAMLYFRTMFGLNGRQIFILLMLVVFLFAASKYVPPYFTAFQFNDFIRQEVKFAASSRKTTDRLRQDVLQKAKEMGVPIEARDIHITRKGPSFTFELEYRFPIDWRIYHHELVFHALETGEIFENASN